jgi:hypothetical protein
MLLFFGYTLLNEYVKQEKNFGVILNTTIINNIGYKIPIYNVQKNNTIYIVYEQCIIENITKCNQHHYSSNIVYFEKINGLYIISNRNHFILYFALCSLSVATIVILLVTYAYYDFNRIRRTEFMLWSKQKKYDIDVYVENNPQSLLFY